MSILLTIKSKQIGRKQPQNKSTDLSQTDMMNDVATSVSIHPIETLQSSNAEISSEEVQATGNSQHRKRNRTVAVSARLSHLHGYEEAPSNLQAWIHSSCSTSMTFTTEAGRRLGDYNVRRIPFASVQASDIGLAAVETPDEDEQRDCEFLACSNLIFFEFLGTPGTIAYIKCLGSLESNINSVDLINNRFKIESPTHFLVASGDFLLIAEQLKLEEPDRKRAPLHGPQENRGLQRAQETTGERTEGGEKGVSYYIVTRDGQKLPTRDKSNLQQRCDQLEFMWRAADKGLWKHIAGSGYKLQAEIYWKILLEEAEALHQPVGSVFQRASKISLISGTAIAKDSKALELFLRGDFGEEGLTLESFCAGSKLSTSSHPCVLQNTPLVSALEALGVALEVLFSSQFAGVCDALIEALRGHERPLRLTDSGFLVHSIERVFVKFFRTVSKEDKALEFPDSNITNPAGCASLLKSMLSEMMENLTDVGKATVLEKRYTILVRLRKERIATPSPMVKAKSKTASPQEREKGDIDQCGSHLGQLLKAMKKNGSQLKCVKGIECKYKHGRLDELTRSSATKLISTMPGWLQDCLTPLVASCKAFKA